MTITFSLHFFKWTWKVWTFHLDRLVPLSPANLATTDGEAETSIHYTRK